MPRKKEKKDQEELLTVEELEEVVSPYELSTPCQFVISAKQFDSRKMANYSYIEAGRFWRGADEMLVLDVK